VHDPARNKASIFAISTGNTPFGDFTNEYAVFVTFDESGEKITSLDKMVDSAFLMTLFPQFKRYLQKNPDQWSQQAGKGPRPACRPVRPFAIPRIV
jgi:hypothetical protein